MERFYRRARAEEGKNVVSKGELYFVEDVTLSGGVLTSKSGTVLTPLAVPTPSPAVSPTPAAEPTVIATPK
jgi:hypothetical protein